MSAVDDIAAYLAYLKTGGNRIDQIIFDEIPNGEEMSATDELRRLLDGRGVEWQDFDDEPTWMGSDGEMHYARQEFTFNGLTGNVTVYHLTPAEAVEATLGRGTCRIEKRHMDWRCTGCGEIVGTDDPTSELFIDGNAVELWHYCPNCGAKVVDA